jgi:hypothetical protein
MGEDGISTCQSHQDDSPPRRTQQGVGRDEIAGVHGSRFQRSSTPITTGIECGNFNPDFTFDGVPMAFPLARHLAATGYVCVSWSLYDRLANVCGRLASWKDIPDDSWQDPKLWGNLMGEGSKNLGGFLIQQPLANAYGWPTGVATKYGTGWCMTAAMSDATISSKVRRSRMGSSCMLTPSPTLRSAATTSAKTAGSADAASQPRKSPGQSATSCTR